MILKRFRVMRQRIIIEESEIAAVSLNDAKQKAEHDLASVIIWDQTEERRFILTVAPLP